MKKSILLMLCIVASTLLVSCSLNLNISTESDEKPTEATAEAVVQTTKPDSTPIPTNAPTTAVKSQDDTIAPFYGVWCTGSKKKSDADKVASELIQLGYNAQVIVTTDWENLNPEKYYVVTSGMCSTKAEAETLLSNTKADGYKDAYIKYTGNKK